MELFLPPSKCQQSSRIALLDFSRKVDNNGESQYFRFNDDGRQFSNLMNSRGMVLVQVLIMGVLLLILVTVLVRVVTHHYQAGALAAGDMTASQAAQASISAIQSAWNNNDGQNCSS